MVDTGLAHHRESFAERFQHACEHEISAELHCIRLPRFRSHNKRVASNSVEQWTAALNRLSLPRNDDDQLLAFGCFGTTEHRTAQKLLSFAAVLGGKPPGKCRADRATRDMNA